MGWFSKDKEKMIGGQSAVLGTTSNLLAPNRERQLREYQELVFSCVSLRAQEVAQYHPQFGHYNNDKEFVEDPRYLWRTLLEHPNDYQTKYELWEATQTYIDLQGEAFWYLELTERSRTPVRIHMIKPSAVEVVIQDKPDETGRIKIGDVAGYTVMTSQGQIPLERDEVVHFKTFNPLNPYRGMSLIEAGFQSISIDRMTGEFQQSFMANNATPSSIVSIKGNIGKEAFDKVKRMFVDRYGGSGNAGKSLFIREADIDVQQLGLSLADLDFKHLKDATAERIRSIFGVPRALLGSTEGAGLSRANIEAEEYIFQKYQIEPIKTRFDDQLRLAIKQISGDDIEVRHEVNIIQDRQMELAEAQAKVNVSRTINEQRILDGELPIAGGDRLYVPFNLMPLEAQNPALVPVENSFKAIRKTTVKKVEKSLHDRIQAIEEKLEPGLDKILQDALDKQLNDVLNLVDRLSGRKSVEIQTYHLTSVVNTTGILDALVQYLLRALQGGGDLASLVTGQPDAIFLLDQAKRDAIWDSTDRLLKSFDLRTVEQIQGQVAFALENRLTVDELKKNIELVYQDAKGYRAERIARTELYRATNEGLAEGYKQQGYSYVKWTANPTSCEWCKRMNGKIAAIGTPFLSVGETIEGDDGHVFTNEFSDAETPPIHPNCACGLMPVAESELKQSSYTMLEDDTYARLLETENDDLAKALSESTSYVKELEKIVGIDGHE